MWMFWALKLGFNIDIWSFWPLFPKKIGEILFYFLVTLMATPDSLDRTGHVNTFLSTN